MSGTDAAITGTADKHRATEEDSHNPKSLVLFSDGTGNSSAKLFKTNVWRMYEAVDLGPAAAGKRSQVSYYDDGVGTSGFRPLAVLGGAFGYGLKRNVLDIYQFACRNYRPGDEIHAFGFSRGAFTIRLVIALIASQGLVKSSSEAELRWKSLAAYRAFRANRLPRRLRWPTRLARALRNQFARTIGHVPPPPKENNHPTIRFVGVWDTVAAYGGPIVEITRAIDNWIFPLSMPNYRLSDRVLCARHALALDDERDAFHPLLWDEVGEAKLVEKKKVAEDRLRQVWFTGMHSDVGGGYPDESLSYVSLLWMMEEAERAGLRTLTVIKERYVALASSYGPIHDSRAGLAAYYRYQPRKISAWLDPVSPSTLGLRDPAIADESGAAHGLLRSVKVHESVISRIANGTDRYAPISLPLHFSIVPPQAGGENIAQADSESATVSDSLAAGNPTPIVSAELRSQLDDATGSRARVRAIEALWDSVWWRRVLYFTTLALTLVLLALPLFASRLGHPPLLADGRTWVGGIIRLLTMFLPSVAAAWVDVYADNPFYFLVLLVLIAACLRVSTQVERRLRDRSRRIWRLAIDGQAPSHPRASALQRFRNSRGYQRFLQAFKWRFLPDAVVTPLIACLLVWVGLVVYTQARLPFLEHGDLLCRSSSGPIADVSVTYLDFHTRDVCGGSVGLVREGERYVVIFDVVDPWFDASLPATPEGIRAGEFPWGVGYLAAPLRRVINAHYLQPLLEIREAHRGGINLGSHVQIYALAPQPVAESRTRYRAEFVAARTGELFLFVNDAMIPSESGWFGINYRYFYEASGDGDARKRGNRGSSCVRVERASATAAATNVTHAEGSVCARAAERMVSSGEGRTTPDNR